MDGVVGRVRGSSGPVACEGATRAGEHRAALASRDSRGAWTAQGLDRGKVTRVVGLRREGMAGRDSVALGTHCRLGPGLGRAWLGLSGG